MLRRIAGLAIGIMFVVATLLKISTLQQLVNDVQVILPLGEVWVLLLLTVFTFEFVIGWGLILGIEERGCWLGTNFLLLVFTVWLVFGMASGAFDACGCFGRHLKLPLEWAIARNLFLLVISVSFYVQLLSADSRRPPPSCAA